MNKEQNLFFEILNKAIHGFPFLVDAEDEAMLSHHFLRQDLAVVVCGNQKQRSFPMLQKKAMEDVMQFYRIFSFFRELNKLLQEEGIHYYILKGFGLCGLYPREEMRRMSDVDVYIPDAVQFEKVQKLFADKNYQISSFQTGHHVEYYCVCNNDIIKCELHAKLVDSLGDKKVTEKAEKLFLEELGMHTVKETLLDVEFPILPPTLDLWYNMMHILHHFLGYGIGIRPLCDITLFIEKKAEEINNKQLRNCLQKSGMSDFADAILTLCHDLLGLENNKFDYQKSEYAESLLNDLWFYDENTRTRERSPINISRNKFISYVAVCHRQMKYHFPKLSKIPVLWPGLWVVTIVRFLKDVKSKKVEGVDVILQENENRRRLAYNLLRK